MWFENDWKAPLIGSILISGEFSIFQMSILADSRFAILWPESGAKPSYVVSAAKGNLVRCTRHFWSSHTGGPSCNMLWTFVGIWRFPKIGMPQIIQSWRYFSIEPMVKMGSPILGNIPYVPRWVSTVTFLHDGCCKCSLQRSVLWNCCCFAESLLSRFYHISSATPMCSSNGKSDAVSIDAGLAGLECGQDEIVRLF